MSRLTGVEAYGLVEAYTSVYAPQELTEEQVWEEVENWVNNLLEEGYDLSDYTWEELYKSYINEAAVNLGGNAAVNRVKSDMASQAQSDDKLSALRQQRFGGSRPTSSGQYRSSISAPSAKPKFGTTTPKGSSVTSTGVSGLSAADRAAYSAGGGNAAAQKGMGRTSAQVIAQGKTNLGKMDQGKPAPAGARPTSGGSSTNPKSGLSAYPAAKPAAGAPAKPAASPAASPAAKPAGSAMDQWAAANPKLAAAKAERDRTRGTSQTDNPLMKDMRPKMQMTPSVQSPTLAKDLGGGGGNQSLLNNPNAAKAATPKPTTPTTKPTTPTTKPTETPIRVNSSYEWPSGKTIKDLADAYTSIYEGKKKDQDEDGDNDFADVRIARMIASGMTKAEAIAAVRNKEYNEEYELAEIMRHQEGRDAIERRMKIPGYTPPTKGPHAKKKPPTRLRSGSLPKEIDEATRMRKELGKEGEIATRQELTRRSKEYQRSGSVDRTIAAAERGATNPYVMRGRNETEADYNKRKQEKSKTLTKLAANRKGSVRSGEGLRGYAAKVEGDDKDLQSARGSARSAGTLTPAEKTKMKESYYIIASYLLENNFANTQDSANIIIENMSETWIEEILEAKKSLPIQKMKNKEDKLLGTDDEQLAALRTPVGSPERKARMRDLQRFDNINTARTSTSKRGGKQPHPMPEVGRYKPKDED